MDRRGNVHRDKGLAGPGRFAERPHCGSDVSLDGPGADGALRYRQEGVDRLVGNHGEQWRPTVDWLVAGGIDESRARYLLDRFARPGAEALAGRESRYFHDKDLKHVATWGEVIGALDEGYPLDSLANNGRTSSGMRVRLARQRLREVIGFSPRRIGRFVEDSEAKKTGVAAERSAYRANRAFARKTRGKGFEERAGIDRSAPFWP